MLRVTYDSTGVASILKHMIIPTRDELAEVLKTHRVSKRLVRDIRYVPEELANLSERDFLAVTTKSGNEGVMLFEEQVMSFDLQRRAPNKAGRVEAIICDLCSTWQRGTASAIITFKKSERSTVSYLVCADLNCSLHVRDMTTASKLSRVQLREHITPEARIERLLIKLKEVLS